MFFPFMIDLTDRKVLVVGGGAVAARKCALFLDFGADVTAVAPAFSSDFPRETANLTLVQDVFREHDLAGAAAAVAATDDADVNRRVSDACRRMNIPVNVVDDPEECTFIVPAVVRRGELTLAVSTGGASPALAGSIRRELEARYGEEYARRVNLLARLRPLVKAALPDPQTRRATLIRAAALPQEELELLLASLEEA